jgi:hypothetical protein
MKHVVNGRTQTQAYLVIVKSREKRHSILIVCTAPFAHGPTLRQMHALARGVDSRIDYSCRCRPAARKEIQSRTGLHLHWRLRLHLDARCLHTYVLNSVHSRMHACVPPQPNLKLSLKESHDHSIYYCAEAEPSYSKPPCTVMDVE